MDTVFGPLRPKASECCANCTAATTVLKSSVIAAYRRLFSVDSCYLACWQPLRKDVKAHLVIQLNWPETARRLCRC